MLVATEYFTKFMEVIPLKTVNQQSIIDFITKYIIYRFRIIESITTNQGTIFTGEEIQAFVQNYKIKLLHSSLNYTQANGQAEATNKLIKW